MPNTQNHPWRDREQHLGHHVHHDRLVVAADHFQEAGFTAALAPFDQLGLAIRVFLKPVKRIVAGAGSACAILVDNRVLCWGSGWAFVTPVVLNWASSCMRFSPVELREQLVQERKPFLGEFIRYAVQKDEEDAPSSTSSSSPRARCPRHQPTDRNAPRAMRS
jgi:hypothetical protein